MPTEVHADLGRFDGAWRPPYRREIALKPPLPDNEKAQAHCQSALAIARQQQAKSWELRAAMSMARLWRNKASGMMLASFSLRVVY